MVKIKKFSGSLRLRHRTKIIRWHHYLKSPFIHNTIIHFSAKEMFFYESSVTWLPPARLTTTVSSSVTVASTSSDVVWTLLPTGVPSEPSAQATDERVDRAAGCRRRPRGIFAAGWGQWAIVVTCMKNLLNKLKSSFHLVVTIAMTQDDWRVNRKRSLRQTLSC